MTAPVNPNSSPDSIAIDIPTTEGCSDVSQANNSLNAEGVQNNERPVISDIQGSQVTGQCSESRNVPYMDRIFGTNFGLPRIYSIFPLMNSYPSANSSDTAMAVGQTVVTPAQTFYTTAAVNGTLESRNRMPVMPNGVAAGQVTRIEEIQPPTVDFSAPPPYDSPPTLPTYEEVEREKVLQGEIPVPPTNIESSRPPGPRTLAFLAIDTGDVGTDAGPETKLLGTDFMFFVAFMIALFFNWIGFLLLMCFCHTVAARYGALSGFGLSLAKWTVIVKKATDMPVQNGWLWWLITAFGLLICIRSYFQYVNIKRGWRLMSAATQERVLFFY